MIKNKKLFWASLPVLAIIIILAIIMRPQPKAFSLREFNYNRIDDIKGFAEGNGVSLNADSLAAQYKVARAAAKAKAEGFIRQRDLLNALYQSLCVIAAIASLVVSYL